jgi:hypothetical protein
MTAAGAASAWGNSPGPSASGYPWAQYFGATAAAWIGIKSGLVRTVSALTPWMRWGAAAGGGAAAAAGAMAGGAAVYATGVLAGCWLACAIDPCAF